VLLVSTDPAHSLGDVLVPAGRAGRPRPSLRVGGGRVDVVELDADRALARWIGVRRRHLRAILVRGTYLDDDDVDRVLGLSVPGVDELIGLVELARLAGARPYDLVVVDTAPTGHTLRLLAMPETLARIAAVLDEISAKHRFLAESLSGAVRRDAADAVVSEIAGEAESLGRLLRDDERARFTWVMLPETLALEETRDALATLEAGGIRVREIVVNRVTPPGPPCRLCEPRRASERRVLAEARRAFPGRALRLVADDGSEPRGPAALRRVGRRLEAPCPPIAAAPAQRRPPSRPARAIAAAPSWLHRLAPPGIRALLFAGKGGVGKTSCAAATALALAASGVGDVLLLSTDPAHSLADVLAVPLGDDPRPVPGAPRLTARELDAPAAFAARRDRYRAVVDELFDALTGGARFDVAFDRSVVRDLIDLAPPGIDEILAMLAVVEALGPGGRDLVVLDTAPTGHTLRLLALPGVALEWVHALMEVLLKYRQVVGLGDAARDLVALARDLRGLQALLTDPARCAVVAVTRPAGLPRLETDRLLRDAGRLGLRMGAVVVNDVTPPGCARCRRAAALEARAIAALAAACASPARRGCAIIVAPAVAPPPRGAAELARWWGHWELHRETA